MKLRTTLTLVALALAAMAAAWDDGGGDGGDGGDDRSGGSKLTGQRTFRYYSFDTVNADFSKAGNPTLTLKTTVNVNTFLYITGNMSANWHVTGWGTGTNTNTNSIFFYHNGTLTFSFSQFADPKKVSGTQTGSQTVSLQGRLKFYNNKSGTLLYDSNQVPIQNFNSMFSASGPQFATNLTGGVMRLDFSRTINITPEVGPGSYQNVGSITVTRN